MDTLTHIVIGASLGELVAGKSLGKKAMGAGIISHSLPDIDFVAQLWTGMPAELMVHRGFTHSILFGVLATGALVLIAHWLFPHRPITRRRWTFLFSLNIFLHIFLDTFNAYGIGWFEPFSHQRFSFHILYVADPLFSLAPFIAFLFLLFSRISYRRRKPLATAGLLVSTLYLCYAAINKTIVEHGVRKEMEEQHIVYEPGNHLITPSPFNTWLWYVVVKDSNGYYTGYRSVFNKREHMNMHFTPRNDSLLDYVHDKDEAIDLLKFAGDYYTLERSNDTLVFNVLRFGKVNGWDDPAGRFTFYYYLDCPGSNALAVQRGRFEGWSAASVRSFWKRIKGY